VKAAHNSVFYHQVVKITHGYLGPAADRFCARQVRNHLDKEPEQLERRELASLIDWFTMAMAVCSDDAKVVEQYAADLEGLIER
jgi:hypothetical protein